MEHVIDGRQGVEERGGRQAGNYLRNAILRKDGEHSTAQHSTAEQRETPQSCEVSCQSRVVA